MSQTRKQKLIEGIQRKLDEYEKVLIETPEEVTAEEYQQLIEQIQELRKALEIVKKF